MRAVILAGGRGTRLAPYTTVIPKPLLPVGDMPILEVLIRQLAYYGFNRVTLSLGYMAEYFKLFFAHHKSLSRLVEVDFVEEEHPTGTAGSLSAVPDLEGTFLVMNGDLLTSIDYRELIEFHRRHGAILTIATQNKKVPIDLGVLDTDDQGAVIGYREKPLLHYQISMGIYVYEAEILRHIPKNDYLDFPDLVCKLLSDNRRVHTFFNDACWLDLGRAEDLQQATEVFLARRHEFLPSTAGELAALRPAA
jgi:NDP-sugar pyrophosphorylase family protein